MTIISEEHRRRISEANKNKIVSAETRKKQSEARKRYNERVKQAMELLEKEAGGAK